MVKVPLRGLVRAALTIVVISAASAACAHGGSSVGWSYDDGTSAGGSGGTGGSGPGLIAVSPPAADGGPGPFVQNTPTSHTTSCTQTAAACTSMCKDFPSTALIDLHPDDGSAVTPADAASHFAAADAAGAGRASSSHKTERSSRRIGFARAFDIKGAGQNLFQITLHAASEANDFVVYTTSSNWKVPNGHMPGTADWDTIRASIWGQDITVTVRGVNMNDATATPTSSSVKFRIAPAGAGGAMIYWAAIGDKNGMSWLEGFNVGDENVSSVLTANQVQLQISRDQVEISKRTTIRSSPAPLRCIGCHAAIPDGVDGGSGKSVAFVDFYPWNGCRR